MIGLPRQLSASRLVLIAAMTVISGTAWAQDTPTTTDTVEPGLDPNVNFGNSNTQIESKNVSRLGTKFTSAFSGLFKIANPKGNAATGVSPIAGGYRITGGSAGEDGLSYPWGMWGSYQYAEFDDDFAGTAFDAESNSVLFGVDVSPWDYWVWGVSLGYDATDVDTIYNGGQQTIDTYTVAPYFGAYLSDYLEVDWDVSLAMGLGYSRVDIDQFQTTTGTRVTSSTNGDRYFFTTSLSATKQYGNFNTSVLTSLLASRADSDAFTDSSGVFVSEDRIGFGNLSIGGEVSYLWRSFEPFASGVYRYDYQLEPLVLPGTVNQPSNDRDDFRIGLGIRYFGSGPISGLVEYNKVLDRDNFDEDSINFLLRADF